MSNVDLHFVWGHLTRKQTVVWCYFLSSIQLLLKGFDYFTAYSGNNTPTDSVVSGKSMCSNRSTLMARATGHNKPYIGWRSQDNLISGRMTTPTERMAYSLRQKNLAGATSTGSVRSWTQPSSSSAYFHSQSSRLPQTLPRDELLRGEQQFVHDSIRSVSTAIMEFCNAPDVPLPPPDEETMKRRHRSRERQQRSRVVWVESSFVSAADNKVH